MSLTDRPLTHDMRQAAESAYQGHPLNPGWGLAAQTVYRGMWQAKYGHPLVESPSPSNTPPDNDPSLRQATHPTPLLARPVQAWIVHFLDLDDHVLMLFPPHHAPTELLLMIKQLNPDRPFQIQPLKQGFFPLPNPDLVLIRTRFAQDPRHITHTGTVKLERDDPPTTRS